MVPHFLDWDWVAAWKRVQNLPWHHWLMFPFLPGANIKACCYIRKKWKKPNMVLHKNSCHYSSWVYCLVLISDLYSFSYFLSLSLPVFLKFLLYFFWCCFFQVYLLFLWWLCLCVEKGHLLGYHSCKNTFCAGIWHLGLLQNSSALGSPNPISIHAYIKTNIVWIQWTMLFTYLWYEWVVSLDQESNYEPPWCHKLFSLLRKEWERVKEYRWSEA